MAIIWEITNAPTSGFDYDDASTQEAFGFDADDGYDGEGCGPSFSTISPLPDGSEDITGCTFNVEDFSVTLQHNEQYQVIIKGTAAVVLSTHDTEDGQLPMSFTYFFTEWADPWLDLPPPVAQPGFPLWDGEPFATFCDPCDLWVGAVEGNFISAAINEVPEPTSVALLSSALIAAVVYKAAQRAVRGVQFRQSLRP